MPNHFTVTIDQASYPCVYDVDTNILKAEMPSQPPGESQLITIQQRSSNTLHQQVWANAMQHLNAEGVFEIPAPPTPTGASPINDDKLADMVGDISDEFVPPHPVLSGVSPPTLNAPSVLKQTSAETVIAVQRVIINQMHSLYAVAVEEDEKMLAVMQRLLDDGETVYNEWRGEDDRS